MNQQWQGKLYHDKSIYADWGMIRDESGKLVMKAQMPYMTNDQENEHRRNKTDPSQDLVDCILDLLNVENLTEKKEQTE